MRTIELTGKLIDCSIDILSGKLKVNFEVEEKNELMKRFDELKNKVLSIKIGLKKKKRSLDANAYCWVLIDKLAQKLNLTKTDIYRSYIKNIGGNNTTVCVPDKSVETLIKGWEHNGIGWQTDTMTSKLDGCTNVVLYYGSSTYDTEQMSRLLDLIIQDCEALGISTLTPRELAALKQGWNNE